MTPYNDTEYYRYDEDYNITDPYGVLIQRKDGTWTSAAERREQEKENFAKKLPYLFDTAGQPNSPLRMLQGLSYVDWTTDGAPQYKQTYNMSLADELDYRNRTGQWGLESKLDYFLNSMTTRSNPSRYAIKDFTMSEYNQGKAFRGINDSLDGLSLYERYSVGNSSGFKRAYQNAAIQQDRIRLAEQDAVAKATKTGSFAGTPWETNGKELAGSLINL